MYCHFIAITVFNICIFNIILWVTDGLKIALMFGAFVFEKITQHYKNINVLLIYFVKIVCK